MSAKDFRTDMGAMIIEAMLEGGDLPLPNSNRLAKVMMEYFKRDGHIDDLKENGYKWRPTTDYFIAHLKDFRKRMRERGMFFEYVRDDGEIVGEWKFADRKMYEANLKRDGVDLQTRTDTYNDKLDDGLGKWKLQLPHIEMQTELLN